MGLDHSQTDGEELSNATGVSLWALLLGFLRSIMSLLGIRRKQPHPLERSQKPELAQEFGVPEKELQPVSVPAEETPEKVAPIVKQPKEPSLFAEQPKAGGEPPPIAEQLKAGGEPSPFAEQPEAGAELPLIAEQTRAGVEPSLFAEQPEPGAGLPTITEQPEAVGEPPPIAEQSETTVEPPLVPERQKTTKEPTKVRRVSIDLGRRSTQPTPSGLRQRPAEGQHGSVDIKEKGERRERIESPYVEINLDNLGDDERAVQLVLPDQQFRIGAEQDIVPSQYDVELNGKKREVICKAKIRNDYLELREERLGLSQPLEKFRVTFPEVIQSREYRYHHEKDALFVFAAIGANRGRLIYNVSNLPKRPAWVLLSERYELVSEPDIEEQQWAWERYKPYRIDLRQIDALEVMDKRSGERLSIPCRPTFKIIGERLVQDDFIQESPFVSGSILFVEAPYKSEQGWNVWIFNKAIGEVMASENWMGDEPMQVDLRSVLPSDFGEFQVDIWAHDADYPDATLFFRWVPSIELDYPREIIIPCTTEGHTSSTVALAMEKGVMWELRDESGQFLEPNSENKWELVVPADRDMVHLSLQKKGVFLLPVGVQVTLPRLRWKTTKHEKWQSVLQLVDRKQLIAGDPLDVIVCTNDYRYKYDIRASLDTNDKQLQQGRFDFKGGYYVLSLNQFYDTIKKHKTDELAFRLEISKRGEIQSPRSLEILRFAPEQFEVLLPGIPRISTSDIRRVLQRVRIAYPAMKGVCDDILKSHLPETTSEPQAGEEFIVHSMALLKYIIDSIGITKIKGHKLWSRRLKRRWKRKIEIVQNRYSERFGTAYETFRRR